MNTSGKFYVVLCVTCFDVSFCTVFNLCVAILVLVMVRWLSGHILGKSYSFGESYVLFVLCLFVVLVVSPF